MCIQRHPCKYKCFQNYSALFNGFPELNNQQNSCFECGQPKQRPCECEQNWNYNPNFGNYNFFNYPCKCPCSQNSQHKQNKFKFCVEGTIKFDGSC